MARDSKKNAAYDSGIRGKERAPSPRAISSKKSEELRLPDGATRIEITPAENGFIVNCSYPPKQGKNDWGWSPPKPKVFTSAGDVAEFIETALKVEDND